MFLDRQNLLEILQYMCFAGLILSASAAYILRDVKKKSISLLFIFLFIIILSLIFYAGILLFITGFIFIFVFLVLYLLAAGISRTTGTISSKKAGKTMVINAVRAAGAVLFCSWLGYFIYEASGGYFQRSSSRQEIHIAGLEDISQPLFSEYSIVLIIIIAAVFIIFIGFTIFYRVDKKDGEV